MSTVLVSAIISTYNSEKFIRGRIENLLEQTISDQLEIIIVNSGSEENEGEIIKEFLDKYHQIKYIETQERETIYKAWNRGIRISEGKYITNANTDDRLRSDALEKMVRVLEDRPNVKLVYADQYYSYMPNEDFISLSKKIKYPKPKFRILLFLQRCIVGSQPVWRSSLHFDDDMWFNESMTIAGDYDFECRVALRYEFYHLPEVLGIYYLSPHNSNKEFENSKLTFEETYCIMDKYARQYIKSLSKTELHSIIRKLNFKIIIPAKVYNFSRSVFNKFIPRRELHSRDFIYWLLSVIYEGKGEFRKSVSMCESYLEKYRSVLLTKYADLLNRKYF